MKPSLTVYKASAGSGKTFTLAVEYIKLLVDNPLCFSTILAVTFTNKATEEMKQRVLSQLYGIWKMLPESDGYMAKVCSSLGLDKKEAARRAGLALSYLVHNYHQFRVETIDSFFQSVMRNLARELDLTPNLRIGLNDAQVEEQAVDEIIDSLSPGSQVLQWLIGYIFANIGENKSWNVIGQVKNFGKAVFRDFYKTVSGDVETVVTDSKVFDAYLSRLRALRDDAVKRMAGYADAFERETAAAGLTPYSFAKKKNGIASYFNKLRSTDFSDSRCLNQTLENCLADAANWASKTSPDRETIIALAENKLMKLLGEAEQDRAKLWPQYVSACCTLKHLDKLRLLNAIETKVRELNNEANRFLLSDTQYLLHTLIHDDDSPFIFEKVGCRLEHIMIDEFQDTSSIQWQNFKVLLKECMSKTDGKGDTVGNLIVGDVKQSIYRWRAGDWRLLNGISAQFEGFNAGIDIKNLQTNYRSERNVVDFNNCFFKIAAHLEYEKELEVNSEAKASELLTAYADVCQSPRPSSEHNGFVRVALLPDEGYGEAMLAEIGKTVDELIEAGASMSDIAVLIRYNRQIPLIADYLMANRPGLRIVSDEAFRLDASVAVNLIVQAMIVMLHPEDLLAKAGLVATYQKRVLGNKFGEDDPFTKMIGDKGSLDGMLPNGFIQAIDDLVRMPLTDMAERIRTLFELDRIEGQNAYICAFYDQLSDFSANNSGNLAKFVEAWDTDICGKTIQSSEADGIRLVSIHKSKGLEFDHVIVPFCDWALEGKDTIIWCKPSAAPFDGLPVVPVDYGKKLLDTVYADDYRDEHMQNRVDNLNLLYVAFTRAGKNLFVLGRKKCTKGGSGCRSEILQKCIPEMSAYLEGATLSGVDVDGDAEVFEYGKLYVRDKDGMPGKISGNVFTSPMEKLEINIETHPQSVVFRQSNKSRDFINGDDGHGDYVKLGNVLHNLFSQIETADDIGNMLRQLEFEGVIYGENITPDSLGMLLAERLADQRVANWFAPRWKVFNECAILQIDTDGRVVERRPDRVITDGNETIVVDFKFGKPHDEHQKQVRQYMELLGNMGYKSVKGYLWYVFPNKIVEVPI